jgi:hypothetical protein
MFLLLIPVIKLAVVLIESKNQNGGNHAIDKT